MISTARVVVFFSAVALGIVSLLTGLVLYFWPRGPRSGWLVIMGLNKSGWSDLHAYSSILALLVIAVQASRGGFRSSIYGVFQDINRPTFPRGISQGLWLPGFISRSSAKKIGSHSGNAGRNNLRRARRHDLLGRLELNASKHRRTSRLLNSHILCNTGRNLSKGEADE